VENNLQQTEEWFQQRIGKFTASQFSKLMKSGRKKDEIFGETAKTYIFDKISEVVTNGLIFEYRNAPNKACDWGNMYEPEAKRVYSEFTGLQIVDCGFIEGTNNTGASPDGLIGEDGLIETKCPYNTTNHIQNLLLKNDADLLEHNDDYYYQIMCQLWVTGRKWCDFVSYDPRATERTCLSILRIERDDEVIEQMKIRAMLAETYMNDLIKQIINRNN
jgi:hypothetical protein